MPLSRELIRILKALPNGPCWSTRVRRHRLWPRCVGAGILVLGALSGAAAHAQEPTCPAPAGVSVQVLGSGGPVADDARASSAYLVWVDGQSRVLVDVGGGAVLRFAEARASFEDLDALLLTHLHADHSADLPALLKSGFFAGRERSLVLAGPSAGGNDRVFFPGLDDYVAALLQPRTGAYPYLGGYLDGTGGLPYLRLAMIDVEAAEGEDEEDEDSEGSDEEGQEDDDLEVETIPLRDSELSLEAISGSHGPVPAVVYAVTVQGRRIVFAGDHNGRGDALTQFAGDADLLVLHMPVPEGAGEAARVLHAVPARLGEIARDSGARGVLLSHFMARSLATLEENLEALRKAYEGPLTVAEDLSCVNLGS